MLNGKRVTNGVTNGVTARHDQWEERLAKAEKAKLRKRRQRAKQTIEKMIDKRKTTFDVQTDGSCIHRWPDGNDFYFSANQWTTYCKLMAVGVIPIVTQTTLPGKEPKLEITVPPVPMGQPDDQWLKACANDPNRDAVQIILK